RTILPKNFFNLKALANLLCETNKNLDLAIALIDVIMPVIDKPINNLIDKAYKSSNIAIAMLAILRDLLVC
ncbi:hypothetical protein BU23DRAFT_471954, partial [Bimuria novae-zelandiae CBS 107.79]